jgi:hypothetical protein
MDVSGPQGTKGMLGFIPLYASAGLMLIGVATLGLQTYDWWRHHFWQETRVSETLAALGVAPADIHEPGLRQTVEWLSHQSLGASLFVAGLVGFIASAFLIRLRMRLYAEAPAPRRAARS